MSSQVFSQVPKFQQQIVCMLTKRSIVNCTLTPTSTNIFPKNEKNGQLLHFCEICSPPVVPPPPILVTFKCREQRWWTHLFRLDGLGERSILGRLHTEPSQCVQVISRVLGIPERNHVTAPQSQQRCRQ